ncbi:MAG: YdhR family protein [Gammaproteobacteria bacterium]|nr:YdhR family protein [Gammaproteobacteria bacterium]
MIATFVTFDLDDNFDADKVQQNALMARSKFENMPGLRSKAFTVDADKKQARNFYIWEEEAAARNFFTEENIEAVGKFYGVRPSVEYVEVATLVDNHQR